MIRVLLSRPVDNVKVIVTDNNFVSVRTVSGSRPDTQAFWYELSWRERLFGRVQLVVSVPYPKEG